VVTTTPRWETEDEEEEEKEERKEEEKKEAKLLSLPRQLRRAAIAACTRLVKSEPRIAITRLLI